MKTIALRFGEHFAPPCGTIQAHQEIIDRLGYVWYGKLGSKVSARIIDEITNNENPRILLICSGRVGRYWAYISAVSGECPERGTSPDYYRDKTGRIKTWFKVVKFENAEADIMSKCIVASSGSTLSEASKHSMSPYFKIEVQ